ncbi:hypothetical protein I3760_02G154200 [Carya illinoinensis]|uniref:Uncharacterized protein n=1 Tax=Carya illinoinensis TaxID=32201 RepID=A0A922K654_CARIL|nr:hypothetical protein I3760_02G154200 [Carya illinoinensis]KAG6728002.1 hypothetical protein I3842_02G151400 [Carya illinoinensis]
MAHHSCCINQKVKKGLWSPEEDEKLIKYISANGYGSWNSVPRLSGLQRCGKSCRLRWVNYLRPDLKRGSFSPQEEALVIELHRNLGNKWSRIAKHLPGRTDNEVKNFWNTSIKKKLRSQDHAIPHALATFSVTKYLSGSEEAGVSPHVLNRDTNLNRKSQQDELHQPPSIRMLQSLDLSDRRILEQSSCSPSWVHFPPLIPPLPNCSIKTWSPRHDHQTHDQLGPNQQDQNFIMRAATLHDSSLVINPRLITEPDSENAILAPEMPELYEIIVGGINVGSDQRNSFGRNTPTCCKIP